jgi:hypothetical protein
MTQHEAEQWAKEMVNELVCYNKIKISVKNIYAEKLISFLIDEKPDYNRFQNGKVLKTIPTMTADEGIAGLLETIKNTNSVLEGNVLENKKQNLTGSALKKEWAREFASMNFNQQRDKASSWLTCGCPENAIPKFVVEWVRGLEDESLIQLMRQHFQLGRKVCNRTASIDELMAGIVINKK